MCRGKGTKKRLPISHLPAKTNKEVLAFWSQNSEPSDTAGNGCNFSDLYVAYVIVSPSSADAAQEHYSFNAYLVPRTCSHAVC